MTAQDQTPNPAADCPAVADMPPGHPRPRVGARPFTDRNQRGRLDIKGVEWWATDPYPTWYRWEENGELTLMLGNGPWADPSENPVEWLEEDPADVPEQRPTFDYVRGVSGWGPRCGCGGKSTLHAGYGGPFATYGASGDPGIFLCAECVTAALVLLHTTRPDQPSYWPGDEGRDERYVDPRGEAGG